MPTHDSSALESLDLLIQLPFESALVCTRIELFWAPRMRTKQSRFFLASNAHKSIAGRVTNVIFIPLMYCLHNCSTLLTSITASSGFSNKCSLYEDSFFFNESIFYRLHLSVRSAEYDLLRISLDYVTFVLFTKTLNSLMWASLFKELRDFSTLNKPPACRWISQVRE